MRPLAWAPEEMVTIRAGAPAVRRPSSRLVGSKGAEVVEREGALQEDQWLFSEKIAHPPIIDRDEFEKVQAILVGRGSRTPHKPHRRPRVYALRGVLLCGLCD
jgi:hypothetical protein